MCIYIYTLYINHDIYIAPYICIHMFIETHLYTYTCAFIILVCMRIHIYPETKNGPKTFNIKLKKIKRKTRHNLLRRSKSKRTTWLRHGQQYKGHC